MALRTPECGTHIFPAVLTTAVSPRERRAKICEFRLTYSENAVYLPRRPGMNSIKLYGKMMLEHRGMWVALSSDESKVVASARTLAETMKEVEKARADDVIYVMVSDEVGNFSFSSAAKFA